MTAGQSVTAPKKGLESHNASRSTEGVGPPICRTIVNIQKQTILEQAPQNDNLRSYIVGDLGSLSHSDYSPVFVEKTNTAAFSKVEANLDTSAKEVAVSGSNIWAGSSVESYTSGPQKSPASETET